MASTLMVRNPAILGDEPVFRGPRVRFAGPTLEHERSLREFLEDFPSVTREQAASAA
jgi:uncharacterized protein (DUF433 family)